MIELGATMPPCRRCKAPPGEDCRITRKEARGPFKIDIGAQRDRPHKVRVRDAKRMSELLDL